MKINIACCISFVRILLTPMIIALMMLDQWSSAFMWFGIAISTDLIDGFVARRFNMQSNFGQLLDPVADKILLGSVMYAMLLMMPASIWSASKIMPVVVWFLLFKELVLLLGGGFLWLRYKIFIRPSVLSRGVSLGEVIFVILMFACRSAMIPIMMVPMQETLIMTVLFLNLTLSVWLLLRYVGVLWRMKLG